MLVFAISLRHKYLEIPSSQVSENGLEFLQDEGRRNSEGRSPFRPFFQQEPTTAYGCRRRARGRPSFIVGLNRSMRVDTQGPKAIQLHGPGTAQKFVDYLKLHQPTTRNSLENCRRSRQTVHGCINIHSIRRDLVVGFWSLTGLRPLQ